jgi:soluble lytic murein transglycosylase-like protein
MDGAHEIAFARCGRLIVFSLPSAVGAFALVQNQSAMQDKRLPLTQHRNQCGKLVLGVLALSATLLASAAAQSDTPANKPGPRVYKYLKGGTPSFSDVPPAKIPFVIFTPSCYACNIHSNINWHTTPLHLQEYADEIALAARRFDLDPALLRALIHAESGFNPRARSQKGAMGLMQLMPGTARMLGVADASLPSENIRGGAKYLAILMARFKNDISLACAGYNAGPEAVQKYAGVPPYTETQVYVQRVKILQQRYLTALQR